MRCSAFSVVGPERRRIDCEEEARYGDRCIDHGIGRERYAQAVGIVAFIAFGKGCRDLLAEGHRLHAEAAAALKAANEACRAAINGDVDGARAALGRAREATEDGARWK